MSGHRAALACAAFLAALMGAASAQSVFRCGSEYRPTPCPGGEAVDVKDTRTDAQRREAAQAAQSEMRTASQLERERRAREAATSGPPIGGFYTLPRPAAQTASAPVSLEKAKPDRRKKKPRTPGERSRR